MLKFLTALFLFPGTAIIRVIGITEEQDGGILRGMVNMIIWGIVIVVVALAVVI